MHVEKLHKHRILNAFGGSNSQHKTTCIKNISTFSGKMYKSLKAYSINFDVCGQCTRDEFQKTKPKIICLHLESIEIAI